MFVFMNKQLLIEIYTEPTYIDEKNSKVWLNKEGQLHRKYGMPAKINDVEKTNSDAEYYINGKKIKEECYLSIEEQIEQIFKEFDFKKIRNVMEFLHWTWFNTSGGGVPNIMELKKNARRLLMIVFEHGYDHNDKESTTGSGGFSATYYKEWNTLKLKFVLEEWEVQ